MTRIEHKTNSGIEEELLSAIYKLADMPAEKAIRIIWDTFCKRK